MICKVCKSYFKAKKENKYLVTVRPGKYLRSTTYECFDCPKCGCQNTVNIREIGDQK